MADVTLKVLGQGETASCSCTGGDSCTKCRLFNKNGGPCEGCWSFDHHKNCSMVSCKLTCNACELTGYVATVPAVCCKSPHKDIWLDKVQSWKFNYTRQDKIEVKTQGATVWHSHIAGRTTKYDEEDLFPKNVDIMFVNFVHVWSEKKGFYSSDLKDYMRLPKRVKLVVMNNVHDDDLERFADANVTAEDFIHAGVDYWTPIQYSVYPRDAKMWSYIQGMRTFRSLADLRGHFASLLWIDGFGDYFLEHTKRQTEKIPQVFLLFQQSLEMDSWEWKRHIYTVKWLDKNLDKNVVFWMLGPASEELLAATFFALDPSREVRFVSSRPWMAAHAGMLFNEFGQRVKSNSTRTELARLNQENYLRLISRMRSKANEFRKRK